jgi:uncharacterized protein with PIN domain
MGIIMDILKEVPLSAVLRERLSEQETKMTILESENKVLKSENANLHTQIQQMQADQAIQGDICPYCRRPKGELLKLVPHEIFGEVGIKVGFYKCANCGKEYDKEYRP